MATRTKKSKRATDHGSRANSQAARLGADPTTIVNPYARPAAGSARPVAKPLPEVVERPDAYAFALQRGEDPPGMDVIGGSIWELVYRSIYPHGVRDECARYRRVIAASRDEAVLTLQRLEFGFAERIELYDARALKMTPHKDTDG